MYVCVSVDVVCEHVCVYGIYVHVYVGMYAYAYVFVVYKRVCYFGPTYDWKHDVCLSKSELELLQQMKFKLGFAWVYFFLPLQTRKLNPRCMFWWNNSPLDHSEQGKMTPFGGTMRAPGPPVVLVVSSPKMQVTSRVGFKNSNLFRNSEKEIKINTHFHILRLPCGLVCSFIFHVVMQHHSKHWL